MLLTLFGIVVAILVLSILIAVHEAGHLLMAKWSNIRVDVFSIGMGKPIWGFQYGETYYQIGRLPFGGFCAFGDENSEEDKDPRALTNSPLWARLLTVIGGSLFNITFAFLVMVLLFWRGFFEDHISNEVVVPKTIMVASNQEEITSPAWEAGLRNGDRIIKIGEHKITHFSEIPAILAVTPGFEKEVTFIRDQKTNILTLVSLINKDTGIEMIGVYPVQKPMVNKILSNSPAEKVGLQEGDLIKAIDGKPINFFYQITERISEKTLVGKSMTLLVERSNKQLTIDITPEKINNEFRLGISSGIAVHKQVIRKASNLVEAFARSAQYIHSTINKMISSITKLFLGQVDLEKNLSGPVRIVSVTGSIAQTMDFTLITQFMVMLSIALAVFNMLPFPGLDGGAILLQTARSAFKDTPLAEKIIGIIEQAGVIFLLILAVFVMFNDVKNISQNYSKNKKTQSHQ
ncbi:MAG: RIP metalloprotease RseP [Brevinema sp.]